MSLNPNVIRVTVIIGSQTITRLGLGTPLLVSLNPSMVNPVKTVEKTDDYAADTEFDATCIAMLTSLFAQSPSVSRAKVGQVVYTAVAQVNNLIVGAAGVVVVGKTYGLTINGNSYVYVATTVDSADVVDTLVILIEAGEEITCLDNGPDFNMTATNAEDPFTIFDDPTADGTQTLSETTAAAGLKDSLRTIAAYDNDWYFYLQSDLGDTANQSAVEWLQTNSTHFGLLQTAESDVIDPALTNDIASEMKALSYDKSGFFYHPETDEYAACALVGIAGAADLDNQQTIWDSKTLIGITPQDYDGQQKTTLTNKNCCLYDTLYGVGATYNAKTCNGDWIDQRVTADWYGIKSSEDMAALQLEVANRNSKMNFDDIGFREASQPLTTRYIQGVEADHFLENTLNLILPSLDPESSNPVTTEEKNARLLRVTAEMTLAGAVQSVSATIYMNI